MRKDLILQTVIKLNLKKEQIGENCDSAFAAVHKCVRIAATESSESEKMEKLISILQSFWRGRSKYIDGCKRKQLQIIVELVFGIGNEQRSCLRQEIRRYTFQELYLYYCYVERMAKGDDYFIQYLQKSRFL